MMKKTLMIGWLIAGMFGQAGTLFAWDEEGDGDKAYLEKKYQEITADRYIVRITASDKGNENPDYSAKASTAIYCSSSTTPISRPSGPLKAVRVSQNDIVIKELPISENRIDIPFSENDIYGTAGISALNFDNDDLGRELRQHDGECDSSQIAAIGIWVTIERNEENLKNWGRSTYFLLDSGAEWTKFFTDDAMGVSFSVEFFDTKAEKSVASVSDKKIAGNHKKKHRQQKTRKHNERSTAKK